MSTFRVEQLPEVDQREIKRGRCPWCLNRLATDLVDRKEVDHCPECDDIFTGRITIDD